MNSIPVQDADEQDGPTFEQVAQTFSMNSINQVQMFEMATDSEPGSVAAIMMHQLLHYFVDGCGFPPERLRQLVNDQITDIEHGTCPESFIVMRSHDA